MLLAWGAPEEGAQNESVHLAASPLPFPPGNMERRTGPLKDKYFSGFQTLPPELRDAAIWLLLLIFVILYFILFFFCREA